MSGEKGVVDWIIIHYFVLLDHYDCCISVLTFQFRNKFYPPVFSPIKFRICVILESSRMNIVNGDGCERFIWVQILLTGY